MCINGIYNNDNDDPILKTSKRHSCKKRLGAKEGEGEDGTICENNIETCILLYMLDGQCKINA